MKTWLLVAAERREFAGVLKHFGNVSRFGNASPLVWPGAKFACEAHWKGDRWWMIANGPGPVLAGQVFANGEKRQEVSGAVNAVISTGLCGALDPALRVGDVVVDGDVPVSAPPCIRGAIHSVDRVITTSREKRELRNRTGAVGIDMETAAIRAGAAAWNKPFSVIRVVSDSAGEDLPLDFNRFQNHRGDFSRTKIALAAMARPLTVMPRLIQFDKDCRFAADKLGAFLADCQF